MTDSSSTFRGWIGVDLDGTLAHYTKWVGQLEIGEPIPEMADRVRRWIAHGFDVRIFTARITPRDGEDPGPIVTAISDWCLRHLGKRLPVTNIKDTYMVELWDDRCVQVEPNTGRPTAPSRIGLR